MERRGSFWLLAKVLKLHNVNDEKILFKDASFIYGYTHCHFHSL
jgi:hypothetical protein